MSATAAKTKPRKPPGRIRRCLRRRYAAAALAVRPYALTLAAITVAGLVLHLAAPGLQWAAVLAAGAVLGIGGDRYREHRGWHRAGGKAARRRRSRDHGRATLSEVARNLPRSGGVPIGTVRGSR